MQIEAGHATEAMKSLTVPKGTLVHIAGWPVVLTREVIVESSPGNIELVTRDLYLRKNADLSNREQQT